MRSKAGQASAFEHRLRLDVGAPSANLLRSASELAALIGMLVIAMT
jgi:hypothetical protein